MSIQITTDTVADERPLELLYACHDKVRRFTRLAGQLGTHVVTQGADAQARDAATQILRYFELALPNHHADEETDVFPALRSLDDPAVSAAIAALEQEHGVLHRMWDEMAPWLRRIVEGEAEPAPECLPRFVAAYAAHAEREEREVFSAIERLPAAVVDAIALRMRTRRGA
ncbi:MAG: hemerythrin domain-containing protein [Rhodocyclaceae bacterium]|jgi:iron-sulfur cluster repair protein YtfE (RIC family)|nr:hemerythrin domain-containing protein [Rhodocyclaceae bacterium]